MRVVGLQELCSLPEGTIFSKIDPNVVEGLYRRGKPIETHADNREYYGGVYADFFYHSLLAETDNDKITEDVKDQPFHDITCGGRWGAFIPDELFVLYEEQDVKNLVGMLTGTITGGD